MRKKFVFVFLSAVLSLSFAGSACAGLINYERVNRIKAGRPASSPTATAAEKASADLPGWMKTMPNAVSAAEKTFDVNRDGKLQTAEVKVYLRDVLDTIKEKGGYTIDSDVLKEYDRNRDGVISRYESGALSEFTR